MLYVTADNRDFPAGAGAGKVSARMTDGQNSTNEPLFQKIDCLLFNAPDVEAALSFYRDRLGLPLAWRTKTAVAFHVGESELVINRGKAREPETDVLVASADEAAHRIVEAGGTILAEPFDITIGRGVVVADPWGNKLVLLDATKGILKTDAHGFVNE